MPLTVLTSQFFYYSKNTISLSTAIRSLNLCKLVSFIKAYKLKFKREINLISGFCMSVKLRAI